MKILAGSIVRAVETFLHPGYLSAYPHQPPLPPPPEGDASVSSAAAMLSNSASSNSQELMEPLTNAPDAVQGLAGPTGLVEGLSSSPGFVEQGFSLTALHSWIGLAFVVVGIVLVVAGGLGRLSASKAS